MSTDRDHDVPGPRVAHIVASAVPPVRDLASLVDALATRGWTSCVALTPTAAAWADVEALTARTGRVVRTRQRRPREADPFPPPDAVIGVLSFNTLNAWAAGLNDNVVLNRLNRAVGRRTVPMVVVPMVNTDLRGHPAYAANAAALAGAGVVLLDPDGLVIGGPDGEATLDWGGVVARLPR